MIDNIRALGHGGFLIQQTPIIYINPWKVSQFTFLADLILIGHDHYDHFSPADIDQLRSQDTLIISNEKVASLYDGVKVLRDMQYLRLERASIRAMPAYSTAKLTHPREDGGLGFIISLNFYDIYYTGDSEWIPEMATIRPDILILPIDGDGTFTPETAAEAVAQMRPRWVIPCNWGTVGKGATLREAELFKRLVGTTSEVILLNSR